MKGPHCALCSLHPWPPAAACCGLSTNIHDTCRPSGDIWGDCEQSGGWPSEDFREAQDLVCLFGIKFKIMCLHNLPSSEVSFHFWLEGSEERLANVRYEEAYTFLASIASQKDIEKGNNFMMLNEPHFFLTLYLRPCDATSCTIPRNYSSWSCIRLGPYS